MPDGTADAELYETDFFAWTQLQARKLKRLQDQSSNLDLDLPHLVEEVEDLGKAERNALRSELRRIIEHCLKLEYSPAAAPRGEWRGSILDARAEMLDRVTATLRRDLEETLPRLFAQARQKADNALRAHGETDAADLMSAASCYSLDELLADGWYPTNRHGLVD